MHRVNRPVVPTVCTLLCYNTYRYTRTHQHKQYIQESSARVVRRLAVGWGGVGGPQAEPPRASWIRPHTARRRSHTGESAAYARRRRHSLTHVRKAFSTAWLLGRRAGRDAGWAGHVPRCHVPPAGRAGAPCGDRPASGPAGPRPGPARTGPTREEERRSGGPGAGKGKETRERG